MAAYATYTQKSPPRNTSHTDGLPGPSLNFPKGAKVSKVSDRLSNPKEMLDLALEANQSDRRRSSPTSPSTTTLRILRRSVSLLVADGWLPHHKFCHDDNPDQQPVGQVDLYLSDFVRSAGLPPAYCRPSTAELATETTMFESLFFSFKVRV
jgi:hypothetical protein